MKLFLDSSVLVAACGSATGASREVVRRHKANGWSLLATPYVFAEVEANLGELGQPAFLEWFSIKPVLSMVKDVLTLDFPVVFDIYKDRPVLFSALAWSDVLLTLDQRDFERILGDQFYGMPILRPGAFLQQERAALRLL